MLPQRETHSHAAAYVTCWKGSAANLLGSAALDFPMEMRKQNVRQGLGSWGGNGKGRGGAGGWEGAHLNHGHLAIVKYLPFDV